ncbi:UNVERIFIED_CONTAM: hypothetical protein Sindi_2458400 [Sesamum indicum]
MVNPTASSTVYHLGSSSVNMYKTKLIRGKVWIFLCQLFYSFIGGKVWSAAQADGAIRQMLQEEGGQRLEQVEGSLGGREVPKLDEGPLTSAYGQCESDKKWRVDRPGNAQAEAVNKNS